MPDQTTDTALLDRIIAGDQAAFGELVDRYRKYAFTVALNFVKSREDAEEVAQDSFVKAYRSLATFQRQSKFSTWLYGIIYHTSMTLMRKKKLDKVSIDDEETSIQLESHESEFRADRAEKKSRSEYIQQAMKMLLPDDSLILTLFYQGEQSLEEIAQVTGYEANTVKVKLHRARQRLRDRMEILLGDELKDLIH
jgi:RNA polymerase sigma-70 factor (ECF subfamily)